MESTGHRTHPIIIIAATAVILTCLVALGFMTGVIPSKGTPANDVVTAPAQQPGQRAAIAPNAPSKPATQPRTAERAPVGSTSPAAGSGAVAGGAPASTAAAPCTNCGVVTGVRAVKEQGEAGLIGPAAGGLIGGVLGHQIGSGTGNTVATVLGAGVGAAAGTEIERRAKSTTHFVIDVRMDDGSIRHFSSPTAPAVEAGSKVKVVDGKLMHG
jgi:outer membrane lipoprotein SlyB